MASHAGWWDLDSSGTKQTAAHLQKRSTRLLCSSVKNSPDAAGRHSGGNIIDEYDRRMVKMDVANDGTLSILSYFVEQGEFGSAVDKEGNLYVADGEIYVFRCV